MAKIDAENVMYAVCFYESGKVICQTNSQKQAVKLAKREAKRTGEEITVKVYDASK